MKISSIVFALLVGGVVLAGCATSTPAPSTSAEIQSFKTNDFSKAPPGTQEKIEAAKRAAGQAPANLAR